jgi:hypothetical protein
MERINHRRKILTMMCLLLLPLFLEGSHRSVTSKLVPANALLSEQTHSYPLLQDTNPHPKHAPRFRVPRLGKPLLPLPGLWIPQAHMFLPLITLRNLFGLTSF